MRGRSQAIAGTAVALYGANCLRDTRNPFGMAREVRFVPMTAARRPLAKPAGKPVVASR